MRVCYVETLGQKLNGSQQSLLNLITQLQGMGVKPYMVCHTDWELLSVAKSKGIKTFVLPQKGMVIQKKNMSFMQYLKYPVKSIYNRMQVPKAVKFLKENQIDIVHINTTLASSIWAIAAKKANIPCIWHIREFLDTDHNRIILNEKHLYSLIRESSCVITISKSVKSHWEKKLGRTCTLVYNGLPVEEYYHEIVPAKFEHDINCLIIGRITKNKGQMDAVQAIEELKKRGYKISLTIIGWRGISPDELAIKDYIQKHDLQDCISLVEYTYDMAKYREASQIGLTCSKAEAFGRVTIEYMLAGLATIGSNSGGTPELITDGKTGLLYPFGTPQKLADQLEIFLNDREKMKELAIAGQKNAKENFSIQTTAKNVYKVYQDILK
ncbi:MAG: glycosyltransferase family 4 protein [Oscillospiraceae bacterium]|nr:glycosyltransferase family 4 protein [Oscillospiraceae bacterium]